MEHVFNVDIPPQTAWGELTAEPFLLDFAAEVGVDVHDLECGDDGELAVAAMDWTFETDRPGIPSLAKRFLPRDVRLHWSQSWGPLADGNATGQLQVDLAGKPSATSTGESRLVPAPAGTTLRTTTATRADLPRPVAGRVQSMIDRELVGWILSVQARVLARRNA